MEQYLTPKSKPYFDKVNAIVKNISLILQHDIFIFGGFVRDLILHYFEYTVNNNVEFIEPKDVDIWVSCDHSMRSWNFAMRNLYKKKDEINFTFMGGAGGGTPFSDREVYSLVKIIIDNINFDMTTDINDWSCYNDLCDFTVNNLSIDMNYNITQRTKTEYTLDDIIIHIKDKQLFSCVNHKKLEKYIHFFHDETEYYKTKLITRTQKLEEKGYVVRIPHF